MASLVDTLQASLKNPEVVRQISQQIGADPQQVQTGIDVGLPLLVSALARNSSTPEGAQSLSNALAKDHDGSVLNNLPAAVSSASARQDGQAILGHVLGPQQGAVTSTIQQQSGVNAEALLQMLAPVVLGALGQQQRQQNLDPSALAGTLQGEQQQLQQSQGDVMSLVTGLLDTNRDGSVVDDVAKLAGQFFGGSGR